MPLMVPPKSVPGPSVAAIGISLLPQMVPQDNLAKSLAHAMHSAMDDLMFDPRHEMYKSLQ